jgi:CHASE2 domain-containing sensor protein
MPLSVLMPAPVKAAASPAPANHSATVRSSDRRMKGLFAIAREAVIIQTRRSQMNAMTQNRLILLIMLAVLAWGAVLSYGAYRQSESLVRPLAVMGCVLGFLGFWLALLNSRRGRELRENRK